MNAISACLRSVTALAAAISIAPAIAQNCDRTSTGLIPVDDLGQDLYLGQFQGGLYPGGVNVAPDDHAAEGLRRAKAIEPLDADGNPDADGKYVLISIGMSNTSIEFCCASHTFMGQAGAHPDVNHTELVIVNGAQGGRPAASWISPDQETYNVVAQRLGQAGVTENQVVAVWLKQANPRPIISLPDATADAYILLQHLGDIVRAAKVRYPNLQMVLVSSRIYAGYATTDLNPEPYAYESAFADKWLIEAQINQMRGEDPDPRAGDLDYNTVAPWIGWAAYLWADGLIPRSDGLIWECKDFRQDGTHPSQSGQEKVGTLLMGFFLASEFTTPWFVAEGGKSEIAALTGFAILEGTLIRGGLVDLEESDNRVLETEARVTGEVDRPHLFRIMIAADTDIQSPSLIHGTIEGRITDVEAVSRVQLRNWDTNQLIHISTFTMGLDESTHTFNVPDASPFARASDGRIEVFITQIVHFPFTLNGFHTLIDLVEIAVR